MTTMPSAYRVQLERQSTLQFNASGARTTQSASVGSTHTRDRANVRGADVCVGVSKVRMIQRIVGFGSDPEIQALTDLEALE